MTRDAMLPQGFDLRQRQQTLETALTGLLALAARQPLPIWSKNSCGCALSMIPSSLYSLSLAVGTREQSKCNASAAGDSCASVVTHTGGGGGEQGAQHARGSHPRVAHGGMRRFSKTV